MSAGLQLVLRAAAPLPIDECLVMVVTLEAGSEASTVSARLNLIEGDLAVAVDGPSGQTARCVWPWPVDAMPRWVELAPGQRLAGALPLLATDTSSPLFPSPGEYTVTATFDAAPGAAVSSAPVSVRRTPPDAERRAAVLRERDVLQSLLSASVLGAAADGLVVLESSRTTTTRTLSALALDRVVDLVASVDPDDDRSVADVVAAVSAVLPGGFADADPRRAAIEPLVGRRLEEQALFRGAPF
ncbi:MAG TPA: hypothetical protein VNO51_10870 [Ilumatobacteraceae bacterium]|nr:hypothetical protein [Ilumatobacteraceae bacterium]